MRLLVTNLDSPGYKALKQSSSRWSAACNSFSLYRNHKTLAMTCWNRKSCRAYAEALPVDTTRNN